MQLSHDACAKIMNKIIRRIFEFKKKRGKIANAKIRIKKRNIMPPALPKTAADSIAPGDFNIFFILDLSQKPVIKLKSFQRAQYLSIVLIFLVTFATHLWLFFEQHIVKTFVPPIVLLMTEVFHNHLHASQEPSKDSPAENTDHKAPLNTGSKETTQNNKKEEENRQKNEPFDPLSLDESRIKILLSLYERETELRKWEDILQAKENLNKAVEAQLDKKRGELGELKKAIENIAKANNDDVMKNIKKMVSVYETMKPEAAARIFNELPMQVLMNLIKQMNPKKASSILSQMNVDKAKALTDAVAFSPHIPETQKKEEKKT